MNFHLLCLILLSLLSSCQPNRGEGEIVNEPVSFSNPPEWSKYAIWYQIFAERFRNGDVENDPKPADIVGAYPGFVPEGWQITPWTGDWYVEDPYISNLEDERDYYGNPLETFNQKVQLRRYGGDLQGVFDCLDYIDSLGVTAIYFNPLNEAPSLHKYDPTYWRHIDNNFGPDPIGDEELIAEEINVDPETWKWTSADKLFLSLVGELHKRGIKVILDYSWNHTGHTFWAWQDLVENQQNSDYADWYWVKSWDDPETQENEFSYRGWANVRDLPEIQETEYPNHDDSVTPFDGNVFSQAAKDHILAVTRRWLDPNQDGDPSDGIDGYRLDVAAEMPMDFWRDYRSFVKEINPEAYLVGEVWWEKWPDRLLDPAPYLEGDVFDAPMNYRWFRLARHFFNASPEKMEISDFVNGLNQLQKGIRKENNQAMMNVVASHDSPRLSTSLFNKNPYKYHTNPSDDPEYKIFKPDQDTYKTIKMLLIHQFTYIGAPHIWAGDEMGMWGTDDPSTRKPLTWPDYQFEDEIVHPLGLPRPMDPVAFDSALFHFYTNLIRLRKNNYVLSTGDIEFLNNDSNGVLSYSRFDEQMEVVCLFNIGEESVEAKVPVKFEGKYNCVYSDLLLDPVNGVVALNVPGRQAEVLLLER